MRFLVLVASLLAGSAAMAQVPTDSLPPLPGLRIPVTENFQPLQRSALRAYAYSVGIPAASVLGGYALYTVLPENGPDESPGRQGEEVAYAVMIIGGLTGSLVGNFTLGAQDDVVTSLRIRGLSTAVGGGLLFTGGLLCVLSSFDQGGCSNGTAVVIYAGAAVLLGGLASAIGYDLATIPGNAREARLRRQRPLAGGVTVAPPEVSLGYSVEANAPILTFRMGL
ncbi:hypothetical protein [Rubricoccus marinus]|uniref:Uncharacterized protein n=1 Tax=Rubricoccus marinus TaxID=716817 RepID=A0A259U0K7_9BACT|nr:hypothetical protein [Rubricoccus marinus]OZC03354.1 hypothetical protein BSZ36_10395 [Rubricoccus marinus]